jgi:hypothetical protein
MDKEDYLISKLSSKYIGDDAAVIGDTLYSMDAFFEDVHFKRDWMSLAQIGRKAMLINLSILCISSSISVLLRSGGKETVTRANCALAFIAIASERLMSIAFRPI